MTKSGSGKSVAYVDAAVFTVLHLIPFSWWSDLFGEKILVLLFSYFLLPSTDARLSGFPLYLVQMHA